MRPEDGGFALDDRPVESWDDPRGALVSFDDLRDELAVEVEWDGPLPLAVRLCAALTDDRVFSTALAPDRLDTDGSGDLSGLVEDNRYLLRRTRCLGYLKDAYDAHEFIDRLQQARQDLLELTTDLRDASGEYDAELASEILRRAHGLIGTVKQLCDLAGVDVIQHVRMPDFSRNLRDKVDTMLPFFATATAISGRYGHYSAYRVLYERRDEKREDLLSAPQVVDPIGDLVDSWVLSGPGIHDLADDLDDLEDHLDLQEDREKFARFVLDVPIERAHRREAVATLLSRLERIKRLHPTREAVSLLLALTGSPVDIATALAGLGSEAAADARDLEFHEIRTALADLPAERILPDVKGPALSRVVATLLRREEWLSTSALADAANCSTQSIRNWRDQLAAVGLVAVDEQGAGRATRYRIRLPWRAERRDEDAPRPAFLATNPGAASAAWIHDAVHEVLLTVDGTALPIDAADLWRRLVDGTDHVGSVADRWPWLADWLEVLVAMVGERSSRAPPPPGPRTTSTALGAAPPSEQQSLDAALAD
jgi:hypothetical protein